MVNMLFIHHFDAVITKACRTRLFGGAGVYRVKPSAHFCCVRQALPWQAVLTTLSTNFRISRTVLWHSKCLPRRAGPTARLAPAEWMMLP